MYAPARYRIEEAARRAAFVDAHGFAMLVDVPPQGGAPLASHLPLLRLDDGLAPGDRLLGHIACVNPQAARLRDGVPVLAVFTGPDGYVSPAWYVTGVDAPTWNYSALHVTGHIRLLTGLDANRAALARTVAHFEAQQPGPWPLDQLNEADIQAMLPRIQAFEIVIQTVEALAKFSQERPEADRAAVIQKLGQSPRDEDRALAAEMAAHYCQ